MKYLVLVLIAFANLSCAQDKKPLAGDTQFQRELNAEFKDASKSPLKKRDLKNFEGLDFFKFDAAYVVEARVELKPNSEWFKMQTTTSRLSNKRIFAEFHFKLKGKNYMLNVYQDQDLMQEEGFEDYLFLPFIDDTNGLTSYGGGRYVDLTIPEGNTVSLDFNTAYNPYCAYNEKYSCPIVPRNNYLDLELKAGVKAFVK
jgi:hypothetical protein